MVFYTNILGIDFSFGYQYGYLFASLPFLILIIGAWMITGWYGKREGK